MIRTVLNIRKCAKHLKRQFTEEQILMKRCLNSLVFSFMQSKVTMSFHIIGIRPAKMKTLSQPLVEKYNKYVQMYCHIFSGTNCYSF